MALYAVWHGRVARDEQCDTLTLDVSVAIHLWEVGTLEEARTIAIKEAVAWQVQQAMLRDNVSKVEMAKRMRTSRAALDRLLDPGNGAVTLQTLSRAPQMRLGGVCVLN